MWWTAEKKETTESVVMCYYPRMAKTIQPRGEGQDSDPDDDGIYDEISAEDAAQAEAGTLFSIQGERFANVQWSIHRYRTRSEMAADPSGEKTEWVLDVVGELNGTDLVTQIGGGTFRFYGYVERTDSKARRLAYNRLISLAGPRRDFASPPPVAAVAPSSNGLSRGERVLIRMLRQQELRIQSLERTPAPPVEKASSITELVSALASLDSMRQRGQPVSDTGMAKELFQVMTTAMNQGIELGQAREPATEEGGASVLKIAEVFMPLANRILDRLPQRRPIVTPPPGATSPPPPPSAAAPTAPPSSVAEVVEDDEQSLATARMMVVVDLLARGASEQADIVDCADSIAEILTDSELAGILNLPDQAIVGDMATRAGARYPVLATESGATYLRAVLTELRIPPEDES